MHDITTTLFSKLNGADKVYVATLKQDSAGLWTVFYQNGKRGATLTTPKAKNPTPLEYGAALKVFNDLVSSKKTGSSKYVEDESLSVAYQDAPDQATTGGFMPQLLNPVDEAAVEQYLTDDAYCAQQKFDGERRPVRKTRDRVIGINKKGDAVALSLAIADAVNALPAETLLLDGEDLGDRIAVFDLLEIDGEDLRGTPYRERYRRLEALIGQGSRAIFLVDIAIGTTAKRQMLSRLRAENAEGIVFKNREAGYTPNRPSSLGDWLKLKFTDSATCEVISISDTKRSITVGVYDESGNKVPMGACPIPPNKPIPAIGSYVEISYLYAVNSLFQPVYLGKRNDQGREDCTLKQIKFKAGVDRLAA